MKRSTHLKTENVPNSSKNFDGLFPLPTEDHVLVKLNSKWLIKVIGAWSRRSGSGENEQVLHLLTQFLRGNAVLSEAIVIAPVNGQLFIPQGYLHHFKDTLSLSDLRFEEETLVNLFLVRELMYQLFVEIHSKIFKTESSPQIGKRKPNRPIHREMKPYWDLMKRSIPYFLALREIRNETDAIVLFAVMMDSANFSRSSLQIEKKLEEEALLFRKYPLKEEGQLRGNLRSELYIKYRTKWEKPGRDLDRPRKAHRPKKVRFHAALVFLRSYNLNPNSSIRDLKIPRYIADVLDVRRKSIEPLSKSDIDFFCKKMEEYKDIFKRLGVWPSNKGAG